MLDFLKYAYDSTDPLLFKKIGHVVYNWIGPYSRGKRDLPINKYEDDVLQFLREKRTGEYYRDIKTMGKKR